MSQGMLQGIYIFQNLLIRSEETYSGKNVPCKIFTTLNFPQNSH